MNRLKTHPWFIINIRVPKPIVHPSDLPTLLYLHLTSYFKMNPPSLACTIAIEDEPSVVTQHISNIIESTK